MRIAKAAALTAILALGGCGGIAARMEANRSAWESDFAASVPTCSTDKECEVKWSAARQFVNANTARRIQTMTNDYIETYNPVRGDPGLAWRVSKDPSSDGKTYRINAQAFCSNMFGCVPDAKETMLRFNRQVDSSWRP